MPAWRREAERAVATVAASVSWREWGDPLPERPASVVALSLVGYAPDADERRRVFERLDGEMPPDAVLIVADHNRPRRRAAALGALWRTPWVPGASPAARWRRLAHPTARELQAVGFRVERLALVAGERVQIVIARKAR